MKTKSVLRMACVMSVLLVFPGYSQNIFDEIRHGRTEAVKKLIEEDPELVHMRLGGVYPLHQAVRHRRMEIAQFLISKGADVNKFGKEVTEFAPFEFTPVTEAIRSNNIDMIKMFFAKGADVNKRTSLGESYLHFAAFLNRTELAEYFVDSGLDVNIRKSGNLTPLHIAAVAGNRAVAELLIKKGADLDLRSSDGGTPLHFAIAAGHQDIAELLRSRGAKDSSRNFPEYKGKYLGVKEPVLIPEPFAPELFRDIYRVHSAPAFSPDGKEVFWECMFMRGNNDASRIWFMKEEKGRWTEPKVAPFSEYPSGGPAFFHDGKKLVYSTVRPRDDRTTPAKDLDLWVVEREGDKWGNPTHLEIPLNKDGTFEVYPIVAKDGTIYLNAGYRKGYVKSAFVDGKYSEPVIIGDLFDTDVVDTCKELEYILFFSDKSRDERYEYEIYISYHRSDGRWAKPVYLGDKLHPGRRATQAIVSFDGKYLFFGSHFQYYWVDAKIIEELKPEETKEGAYLGQKPPGMTPEIFAPGIICTEEKYELNSVFSPKGDEFYYEISTTTPEEKEQGKYFYIIMVSKQVNGVWTKPELAPFSGKYSTMDMCFSPDGNRLYFTSDRPNPLDSSPKNNIWYVERRGQDWSDPQLLGPPVYLPEVRQGQVSLAANGRIYFRTEDDLYFSKCNNGKFLEPIKLSEAINSPYAEGKPFIAPDESYLLFIRYDMPESIDGGRGLYISFRKEDGSWTPAKNTNILGSLPKITPDGKYFFFSRGGDIYWADAEVIYDLKPKELR